MENPFITLSYFALIKKEGSIATPFEKKERKERNIETLYLVEKSFTLYIYYIKIFSLFQIPIDKPGFLWYCNPVQLNTIILQEVITMSITPAQLTEKERKQFIKDLDIDRIIELCKKNGELAWLEAKMQEKVTRKHYPYVKEKDPVTGKLRCKLDENGCRIVDYTKPPKTTTIPIGFMEIKTAFIDTFMPELKAPKKEKAPTMADKLKAAKEG